MSRDDGRGYWYWDNLSDEDGKKFPWQGRAWYRFNSELKLTERESWYDYRDTFRIEWHIGRLGFRLGFSLRSDYEDNAQISWHLGPFNVYLTLDSRRLQALLSKKFGSRYEREAKIYWFEKGLWWQIWGSEDDSKADPWWRRINVIHMDDLLLGKSQYICIKGKSFEQTFRFDDRDYTATLTHEDCVWKRPRWFATKKHFIDIQFTDKCPPPQFAGKGENDWDQGDDGIWGTSIATDEPSVAIHEYLAKVLERRKRYGMPDSLRGAK